MNFSNLISVEGLAQFLGESNWIVVDCRFWLDDTEKGRRDYFKSHIPGAIYAHLDEHLSDPVIPGVTGRHPLPEVDTLSKQFGSWGIGDHVQVVAYDDRGGMIACRLWWLLHWLGHESVAVLDGGYPAWLNARLPTATAIPTQKPLTFTPKLNTNMVSTAEDILTNFGDPNYLIIDSRAPERYRGENEPIDPIAGRIPGAINHFWQNNLDSKGHFEMKDVLRGLFEMLFRDKPIQNVTFYCGSGVTAAHNILAVVHAGLGMPKLYAGSWSHWINDPDKPILIGD